MKMLWTDGSASPNPGPGGFAVIEDGKPVALGREDNTTNIRMEAMALIAAMEYIQSQPEDDYQINTDSEFWINVLTKWAEGWKENGWQKKSGEIKNLDLVQKIYELWTSLGDNVKLQWTRGHVGTEMNEAADKWANKARKGATL
ncbi:ribonuclease HI [Candidatus Saccharibacteria bacterium]|nr:ribonuclease HI [Candidatus Saccharibacteria bacterium]MBR3233393.1 ribonuclease HI [Candidatus Saccharibacteria bacterium]